MNQIKQSKKFLLYTIILLILTLIIYIVVYHQIGNNTILINKFYKPFMLQHTKGSRIIIDSGSNSLYSLDSYMIEKEFNIQTINLSDAAAYPLKQKLLRIEKYLNKNDIIILPLEWKYYSRIEFVDYFKNNLLGKLHYYYNFDSNYEELKQIINTPFIDFIKNIIYKYKLLQKQYEYLGINIEKFNNNKRGTRTNNMKFISNLPKSCDKYLFSKQLKNGFELSKTFKENIQIIKRLQTKSKAVILTWPTVVGDSCYRQDSRLYIDKFILKIKNYLEKNKIQIIGNPYDNKFPTKYIADTYYHVQSSASKIRTKRFINLIKQNNISQYFKSNKLNYLKDIELSKSNMFNLLNKNCLHKERIGFKSSKVVFTGWSHPEKKFRWSLDNDAKIFFKIKPDNLVGKLKLSINTLGKQIIEIYLNKYYLGKRIVNGINKEIDFNFDPKILIKNKINTIKFEFKNAHIPNDKDKRVLAIAFKSFKFE